MKYFTVYGNCQASVLAACLQKVESFSRHFSYYRIAPCHRINPGDYANLLSRLVDIDLLIAQPVTNQFRGGGFGVSSLIEMSSHCLLFPSLQFYGYFPSLSRLSLSSKSASNQDLLRNLLAPFPALTKDSLFHYSEVRSLFQEGMASSNICSKLDDGSLQRRSLPEIAEASLLHMKEKESLFPDTISISDFIEETWRNRHLFYTPRHPSGLILAEVVRRICSSLDLEFTDREYKLIQKRDHFSFLKLYIPAWIRSKYLANIDNAQAESYYSLTAVGTVFLLTSIYNHFPESLK